MIIKTEIYDLDDFKAWSYATETKGRIVSAGLGEEFINALGEINPDGISDVELNEMLWFDEEYCYALVGLNSHGVVPLTGNDILCGTLYIEDAIKDKIDAYNGEHNTKYNYESMKISEWDFESELDDYLAENQEDETDCEKLANKWLSFEGYALIEKAIAEEIEEISGNE